jgi:tRNA 2-thiouridine synthesizing protein A
MTAAAAPPVVDARGMRCPWPALRLARAMRSADAVTLLSDDPKAPDEVRALARAQNWLVSVRAGDGVTQFDVTRTQPAP